MAGDAPVVAVGLGAVGLIVGTSSRRWRWADWGWVAGCAIGAVVASLWLWGLAQIGS